MKRIACVLTIITNLIFISFSHVAAQCTIEIRGDFIYDLSTTETSRTEAAAWQVFDLISDYCGTDCSVCLTIADPPEFTSSSSCVRTSSFVWAVSCGINACLNGYWSNYNSFMGHDYSGTWDVVCPTLVELELFEATPRAGSVIVLWSTASEADNAGFNIYRSTSKYGDYIQINPDLIPAEGSPTEGASYEYVDDDVRNRKAYWYKLEDIDVNGVSTMHGPISATPRLLH